MSDLLSGIGELSVRRVYQIAAKILVEAFENAMLSNPNIVNRQTAVEAVNEFRFENPLFNSLAEQIGWHVSGDEVDVDAMLEEILNRASGGHEE